MGNKYYIDVGDPTDTSIKLRPLEPASGQALARDLVLKTRRRKGLGEQIAVSKYLDDEFVVSRMVCMAGIMLTAITVGIVGVRPRRFAGLEGHVTCGRLVVARNATYACV